MVKRAADECTRGDLAPPPPIRTCPSQHASRHPQGPQGPHGAPGHGQVTPQRWPRCQRPSGAHPRDAVADALYLQPLCRVGRAKDCRHGDTVAPTSPTRAQRFRPSHSPRPEVVLRLPIRAFRDSCNNAYLGAGYPREIVVDRGLHNRGVFMRHPASLDTPERPASSESAKQL